MKILFLNSSEIKLGHSSVLGGENGWFYSIHFIAIFMLILSLGSSIVVVIEILSSTKNFLRVEFTDRFPLYLGMIEALYGISHLIDHLFLLVTEKYPESYLVSNFLSFNLAFFMG